MVMRSIIIINCARLHHIEPYLDPIFFPMAEDSRTNDCPSGPVKRYFNHEVVEATMDESTDQEGLLEELQRMGLTRYEAQAYLALIARNIDTARQLSRDSGIPRTKIYAVLEGLSTKGWVRILSGWPLLFRPVEPTRVLADKRREYESFLGHLERKLEEERKNMPEKFVISRRNVGLDNIKGVIKKAKTLYMGNLTRALFDELAPVIRKDAKVLAVMAPGESLPKMENVEAKMASIPIVHLYEDVEVAATNILVDEERSFNILKNPYSKKWEVDEMVYEDCVACFRDFWRLGWESATGVPTEGAWGCSSRKARKAKKDG
jgi:sugar-specific transcriptional regulator TrmB